MAEWMAVITLTWLAVISPGPDFAMVSRNALALSPRAGVMTALGIGAGVALHVSYTLLGLGALLRWSPGLFGAIRLAGAGYLIWLGFGMIRAARKMPQTAPNSAAPGDARAGFRMGFWTNALNPKTAIFILSLFTQLVSAQTPLATRLGYGGFVALAHILWFSLVALAFGAPPMRRRLLRAAPWIEALFGVMLIGFGLALLGADLSAPA